MLLTRVAALTLLSIARADNALVPQISRLQGNWAGRYIANVCSDIYSEHESFLLKHQHLRRGDFVDLVCRQTTKLCTDETIADSALGDFDPRSDGAKVTKAEATPEEL